MGGGGREGGAGGGFQPEKKHTKNNRYSLTFCARALYKISSSWLKWFSSFNTNKWSNGQVRGITLPMFYGIQSKVILTWILNNLLNFRNLAQAILYILCWQGFSIFIKAKSKKGHNLINVLQNSLKSLSGTMILNCKPNIRSLAQAVLKISYWQDFSIGISKVVTGA